MEHFIHFHQLEHHFGEVYGPPMPWVLVSYGSASRARGPPPGAGSRPPGAGGRPQAEGPASTCGLLSMILMFTEMTNGISCVFHTLILTKLCNNY